MLIKTIFERFVVVFVSTVLGLVLFEIGLRLFAPQYRVCPIKLDWCRSDETLPYLPKPDYQGSMFRKDQYDITFRTNSSGFRNSHDISTKKPGTMRVIFLGDSFTFGWGVSDDEVLTYLFEKGLTARGQNVEVINAAVYGFDIDEYEIQLGRLLEYKPDIIYLGFCLENDFNYTVRDAGVVKEELRAERKKPSFYVRETFNNLHVVSFIRDRLYILFPGIRNLLFRAGVNNKRDIFLKIYPDSLQRLLNETEKALVKMNKECHARGIKFIVFLIPMREQVYNRAALNAFSDYDADRPNKALIQILNRNHILYIDLLPVFIGESKVSKEKLYFDSDPHWTKSGQRLTADTLIKEFGK